MTKARPSTGRADAMMAGQHILRSAAIVRGRFYKDNRKHPR